jgi:23S rRNA (pseudouridine1915-N3)-methyltransferase
VKIFVYYIGKPKDAHANALAEDFLKRASRYAPVEMRETKPDRSDMFDRHAAARKIFLDPTGRAMDSDGFSQLLARAAMDARDLVFLVGAHDGLPQQWRGRADLLLSLSPMTFSHELARVMLAEQIYRGFAILNRLPYVR